MQNNLCQCKHQQAYPMQTAQAVCHNVQAAPAVQAVQTQVAPQAYQTNPQSIQVPNYSGVNIQIFNPSVGVPGAAPVYNVNAPQYQSGACYPSDYYTQQWGPQQNANGAQPNTNGAQQNNDGTQSNSALNPAQDNSTQQAGQNGTQASNENATANVNAAAGNSAASSTSSSSESTTTIKEGKKTEKRNIVQLTDEYIKNLENYLNSQDKEIRMMGAKEVVARLEEDDSRKSDKALTALINKMLQDPYQPVRILALSMLESRQVTGDDCTVRVLRQMQQGTAGYGQDALQASSILLKMSGQVVQKEFEVKKETKKS